MTFYIRIPGDSKRPFCPLVGGHLTFPKGHLSIPKRSPAELPGRYIFIRFVLRRVSFLRVDPVFAKVLGGGAGAAAGTVSWTLI